MSNVTKKATIQALVNDVLTDLMIETTGEQVYLDATTTVSAKVAEMVLAINERAKTSDVTSQISALKQEILGDVPVEAYNTFTELAAYIEAHKEVSDALTEAIGNKADKSAVETIQATINTLGSLATKSKVSESDLDSNLASKVNAASEGNHSHSNKGVLDGITSDKVTAWDNAATGTHSHSNKGVLDGITSDKVTAWDSAATNKHTHSNKTVLDGITSDKVAAWDGKSKVELVTADPTNPVAGTFYIKIKD